MTKSVYEYFKNIKAKSFEDIWNISSKLNDGNGLLEFVDYIIVEELNRIRSHEVEFRLEINEGFNGLSGIAVKVPSDIYEYDDIKNFIIDFIYDFETKMKKL